MTRRSTPPIRRLRHAQLNGKGGLDELERFARKVREACGYTADPVKYVEGLSLRTFAANRTKARRLRKDLVKILSENARPGPKPFSVAGVRGPNGESKSPGKSRIRGWAVGQTARTTEMLRLAALASAGQAYRSFDRSIATPNETAPATPAAASAD